ncbi:MAG: porin family protein [Wolbachia endosymbiont of Meromenopon meropis]|nr:porin family protein [Wolbachia endosymbiont of Meromenopon meropis]
MIKRSTFFHILLILSINFFFIQVNASINKNLILENKFACRKSKKSIEEKMILIKNTKFNFYVSAHGGKVCHNNSEIFTNGIRTIGKKLLSLIKGSESSIINNIVRDKIKSVHQLDWKINFRYLSSLSLGYNITENYRIDFETMYSWADIKSSNPLPIFSKSISIFVFLLNFFYNPSISDSQYAPYIGFGIGPTVFNLKKTNESSKNSITLNVPWFAYQIKFGLDYSIIPEIKFSLGYRYLDIPILIADNVSTHNIEIGLKFNF